MKIAFEVKNPSKVMKPNVDDVMIFNGTDWYVTTKDEILRESNELLNNCQISLERLTAEYEEFKKEVATQLYEMSELIKKLYSK